MYVLSANIGLLTICHLMDVGQFDSLSKGH